MSFRSLRLRLLIAAAAAISVALILGGFGLEYLFDRHVERRVQDELATYLRQLSGGIEFAPDGSFSLRMPLADPRFDQPFSGLYWQVEDNDRGQAIYSRSLWDTKIALPPDPLKVGAIHRHILPGPDHTTLLVQERRIIIPTTKGDRSLRMAVGLDEADLVQARAAFAAELKPSMAILGLVLLIAVWFQVGMGLKPLEAVRRGVMAIRTGDARRLSADQPDEVKPLIDEVNDLLEAQEQAVERARTRAGDLAHGLKTPLTVLQGEARRLRERGQDEIAEEIERLVDVMRRHVDQELNRTRLDERGTLRGVRTPLREMAERVVRTLQRTPAGESHAWHIDIAPDLTVQMNRDDLVELLGNLLDNAAKWATGNIWLRANAAGPQHVMLIVEDDGPGVPAEGLPRLGERGVRLDEAAPGNGLGLAIVRDIVTAYGGSIHFTNRPKGGLHIDARLPC
ncbi:sensor histidine kinase [Kordiimonas marina]|uniref:sensor histidine kinase n=1 Tax=Kordiimonas marina TaxID=2872312 RepID=UPI001FF392AD|nr:HAMP domain-containing sensor histidine kinase [Kordiimonas marina]MCJ9428852.1 HAMP domain-containing histidine kinase [Kordiimonas marina]